MKYIIKNIEKRHIDKLNKDVAETELENIEGLTINKVTIWSDFPNFENLIVGSEIEGDVVEKEKNGYKNVTMYAPREATYVKFGDNVNKEITVSQLAFTVEALRIRIVDLEKFVKDYKDGKIPADFSADRVQARKEQLEKAQEVVEEINPENIPF